MSKQCKVSIITLQYILFNADKILKPFESVYIDVKGFSLKVIEYFVGQYSDAQLEHLNSGVKGVSPCFIF